MKESLRRPILFAVIVITGSILILFDIPLIVLIPILLIVGFVILLILGAITVAEIKTSLGNLKKIGIIKKLDSMKFFEKSTPVQKDKTQPVKAEAKQPVKGPAKKSGVGLHLTSFVSSIKSLGTLLKERNKRGKKVEDIDKQLDKTVSEKVERSPAPARTGNVSDTSVPLPAGGAGTSSSPKDQDPFLSLSEDEFDLGLLDSLDDHDFPGSTPGISEGSTTSAPDATSLEPSEPEIPTPSLDIEGEAGDILKDSDQGLEGFPGLDSGEAGDSDFGDLDNLSLDGIDLDEDTGEKAPSPSTPQPAPAATSVAAPPKPGKEPVKTEWIKSDAPKDASQFEDQISTQSDMAAFAGGGGSDADLLSSLASDVKHVKVEKNLSLLRELKDFKAPANEIESELTDMYTRMDAIKKTQKKETPPPEETK